MLCEKPSLYNEFVKNGDVRILYDLIQTYNYTNEEVSEVINIYEPDESGRIPEVEHIEMLLSLFPKSALSVKTINAILKSFPDRYVYIIELQK